MNKFIIGLLIIGLMITTNACSTNKTVTVPADTGNSNNIQTNPDEQKSATTDSASAGTAAAQTKTLSSIVDIKKDEFLGKTVTVQGNVENNVKTRAISGFRLRDATESIPVSSINLPPVNTTVTVTGVINKGSVFGIYIQANE
jgi:hypothetical protein